MWDVAANHQRFIYLHKLNFKMRSSLLIIGVALIIILTIGGVLLFGNPDSSGSNSISSSEKSSDSKNSEVPPTQDSGNSGSLNTITITSSGFSLSTLNVNKGDRVTFINQGSSPSWPASAVHPTHTVYPGSDINKCGGAEESSIFDACRGLSQGESYSFIFNEAGSWKYHDHLNPSSTGTIIVR